MKNQKVYPSAKRRQKKITPEQAQDIQRLVALHRDLELTLPTVFKRRKSGEVQAVLTPTPEPV